MATHSATQAEMFPVGPVALDEVEVACIDEVGRNAPPALLASVRQYGLQVPLVLLRNGGRYAVIDGRRRLWCAREVGLARVLAVVREPSPTGDGSHAALTVVLHSTRSANRAAELDALRRLRQAGMDEALIATATGLARAQVRGRLTLADALHPALRDALDTGTVAASVVEAAGKLHAADQEALAATLAARGKLTAEDVHAVRTVARDTAAAAVAMALPGLEPGCWTVPTAAVWRNGGCTSRNCWARPGWRIPALEACAPLRRAVAAAQDALMRSDIAQWAGRGP